MTNIDDRATYRLRLDDHAIYRVCLDCLHFIAHDELPADSDPSRDGRIVGGVVALPAVAPLPDEYGNYRADEFSIAPCDCCGSPLAGERYNVATVFPVQE